MKYAIDLHIHTCLSPCADDDMTPNNIVNMSRIKGLDIIAITDHNAAGNCAAVLEAAGGSGLLVVPGMELCTADEIHLLCYFPDTDTAIGFQEQVFRNLLPVKNREDVFARQVYMNSFDEETGTEDRFLIGACMISTQDAILMARSMGGAVLPAHVDRESFSMLQTFGFIPEEYGFKYLECSKDCNLDSFLQEREDLGHRGFIRSSDAHRLQDILERESWLELEEKSVGCLLDKINGIR
ncbi:MAG: PHP domain-containing protein [Clostridiaceae bacterium]|jgi:PHP family Zn ribbon phosphoesterase|nr:PHP domain-containing protein [Clostridiaceae bacterium]